MQILDYRTDYRISIPFGRFHRSQTDAVKAIPDRRWQPEKKYWTIPATHGKYIEELCKVFNVGVEVPEKLSPEQIGELPSMPKLDMEIPLKLPLYEYQREGVARGLQLDQFINGDDMGLGKTFQSIATISGVAANGANPFPCLVICPSAAKINWEREWHQFSNYKAMVLTDKLLATWHIYYEQGKAQVFIVNYESLKKFFVLSMPAKGAHSKDIVMRDSVSLIKSVIVDEIHGCKEPSSQKCKLTLRITFKKEWVIGLTGSAIQNKVKDLWPQLAIINKLHLFGGPKGFKDRYCEGGNGANNLKELHYKLNTHCYFRREKKDVLKDLPEKQRRKVICDISNRREYDHAKNNYKQWLQQQGMDKGQVNKAMKGEALTRMMALMQISALGKINEVAEYIQEIVEAGQKVVIFCNLISIVQKLKELFPKAVCVTGQQDIYEKQKAVDSFQGNPNTQILIGNIRAAGVAITLTAAYNVGFVEWPWNPALCAQAEDRCNRNGQKNAVMCTYFMGKDTIDERIYDLIMEKNNIANAVTGATDTMDMEIVDRMASIFSDL